MTGSVVGLTAFGSLQADERGKELFMRTCVTCHGADGKGQTDVGKALKARDLTTEPFKQGDSFAQVSNTILKGVPGTGMAGFPFLNQADREALAKYVISIHKPAKVASKASTSAPKPISKAPTPAPKPVEPKTVAQPSPTAPKPVVKAEPAPVAKPAVAVAAPKAKAADSGSEWVNKGRDLFKSKGCNSCHGDDLMSGTPTGMALKARNLVKDPYKQGDTVDGILGTLKKGVPGTAMVAFPMPEEEAKAIAEFILAVRKGKAPAIDASAAAAPTGDSNKVSISYAMSLVAEDARRPIKKSFASKAPGAVVYAENCASCHGENGQGNIAAKMISPAPYYRVRTQPLLGHSGYWLTDKAAFVKLITEGLPGRLMPGNGTLTNKELDDLYNYMRDCFSKQ